MLKNNHKNAYSEVKVDTKKPYTEILLIRHCHPDYSLQKKLGDGDMPLSKHGISQRTHLTEKLLKCRIDKIYASELKRAKETAEIYAKETKKKLNINPRLNEFHWEHWHNMKFFNMSEKGRVKRLAMHKELDAELDKMQDEARRALAEIYRGNKGKKIALFGHGNFIKSLITGILNADIIGFLAMEIFQSSISKIIIDKNAHIKLVYINNVDHLPSPPLEDIFITLSKNEDK